MADYHSLLTRTITALNCKGPADRVAVYERARTALADHLRKVDPPMSEYAMRTELALLEAAIRRVERAAARSDPVDPHAPQPPPSAPPAAPTAAPGPGAGPAAAATAPAAPPVAASSRPAPALSPADELPADPVEGADVDTILERDTPALTPARLAILGAGALALIGLAAYVFWPVASPRPSRPAVVSGPAAPGAPQAGTPGEAKPDPGDGLPYVYRRQPVFYRTTNPPGSIVVDKSQRLLYLVQPNVSALRYGIGVGRGCQNVAGLLRVTRKEEPADAPSKALGVRVIYLGSDNSHLIHGTDAPKSIGDTVRQGCFLLLNDAVADLYDRIQVGAAVVVID